MAIPDLKAKLNNLIDALNKEQKDFTIEVNCGKNGQAKIKVSVYESV